MCRKATDVDDQAVRFWFNGEWNHRHEWRAVVLRRSQCCNALRLK
jgi:hypothetical protein